MSRSKTYSNFTVFISLLLVVLFTYTGVSKLMHLDTFATQLGQMPYISRYAQWISWGIPFLELVIVGLILFPKLRWMGLYASIGLLGLFTSYIIITLQYSDSIPCSCGGVISALGWTDHIVLNSSFIILALLGILWSKKQYNVQNH